MMVCVAIYACSILYAAAYRAARAMGYNKVVTYILDTENGSSLKAAGYTCEGRAGGLKWNGAKAPKQADQYPRQMKTRWVKKKEGFVNLLGYEGVSFRRNVKVTGSAFLPMQTSRLCWNRS